MRTREQIYKEIDSVSQIAAGGLDGTIIEVLLDIRAILLKESLDSETKQD